MINWYCGTIAPPFEVPHCNINDDDDEEEDIEDVTWPRGDTKFLFEC